MSTLSLDLRGAGRTPTLPSSATARGATVSLVVHGVGISALVLVPLLGAANPPEVGNAITVPLVQPITVTLPPAPRGRPLTRDSNKPHRTSSMAASPTVPTQTPDSLNLVNALDVDPAPPADPGHPDGDPVGGECPLGSLCSSAALPGSEPQPMTVRIGGDIREPRLIESRWPQYPPIALAAGVAGRVVMEAHVGRNGRILEVKIIESHSLFDEAALASVRSRLYEPLLLNGVPTDFLITITMAFNPRR